MNALQPSSYSPSPTEPSQQASPRTRHHKRRNPHRAVVIESSAKLVVNLLLGATAVITLVRLIPYNTSQQGKLRELRTEVADVEGRVHQLQADFNRHFDPQQAMSVMQEQSIRVDPKQRQVVWLPPSESANQSTNHDEVTSTGRDTASKGFSPFSPIQPAQRPIQQD